MVVWKINHYPRWILFLKMAEPRISTDEAAAALKLLAYGSLERQQGLSVYPTEALHNDWDEKNRFSLSNYGFFLSFWPFLWNSDHDKSKYQEIQSTLGISANRDGWRIFQWSQSKKAVFPKGNSVHDANRSQSLWVLGSYGLTF